MKLGLRPAAAILLLPFLAEWADASMRLRSPLGAAGATAVIAGTVIAVFTVGAFARRHLGLGDSRKRVAGQRIN